MKTHHFLRFIFMGVISLGSACLAVAQSEAQLKIDSLQVIIERTNAQDSLSILYSQQLELAEGLGDLERQAKIELLLGGASDYSGEKMETHYFNALNIYQRLKDTTGIINALYQVATAKQLQNDYDSTKVYAGKSITFAEQVSDTIGIIKGRLLLSSVYTHLSQYPQSIGELNESRRLAEKIAGNESMVVDILNKESFAYYALEQYDKSAERISSILEILKKDGSPRRLNVWSNNLASVYSLCGGCVSFERRKSILREAIRYAKEANFTYGKAYSYKHLADTYRDEGILDSTRYYLDQIEILLPEINKRDFTGMVSASQAAYWMNAGNRKRAIFYFEKAHGIWEEIGFKNDQLRVASLLRKLYKEQNDYVNAYKYLEDYVSLKDSLFSQENIEKVKELELTYEFEKKQITDSLKNEERLKLQAMDYEYEASIKRRSIYILVVVVLAAVIIAALVYSNFKKQKSLAGLLKVKSDQVASELSQKELLLTEIHHRVKNNFQILSSLLELQAKGTDDPTTRNLISEGKSRVKSMALIHNQLYNTDSLKISLKEYIRNLVAEIQRSFEGEASEVDLSIDPNYEVDVDNMVPLGLIANELITNTYKYANQRPIELRISLSQENDFYVLEFKDNGPGLPQDFNLAKAKSTGIWLVSRLAMQLHGKYEYEYRDGAIFRIYFTQSEFVKS